jgi:BMFP domain-containing protein YqiC
VQRAIHVREEGVERLHKALTGVRGELDDRIQEAMERVFKALDLPRRSDIDALNSNLERVADALEGLGGSLGSSADSNTEPDGDDPIR